MKFPYETDVGQSSLTALEALVKSAGIAYRISSAYRAGDPGFHGKHNAIDIVASAADMARLAAYLNQYRAYLIELIHTSPSGNYYVKRGVGDYAYSEAVKAQHRDHVHLAATNSGLRAASIGHDIIPAGSTGTKPLPGCAKTATAIILTPIVITLGTVLPWILR